VRIRRAVLDAIVEHARADAPLECCGLLLGCGDRIDDSWPARNLKRSPTAFLIDPADHFAAIRAARASGRTVLAAYHSHPAGPATPSPTDVREAHDPALVHVIVSLERGEPAVAAYLIGDEGVVAVPLAPEP